MLYRIVQNVGGTFVRTEVEDIIAAAEIRGYKVVGYATRKSLRSELQGQPRFDKLVGPMWDGDAIRYEDQATYDAMST